MTLAELCDVVWVEIWDNCSAMADLNTYHDIVTRLFIKGERPSSITYKGADGKQHRLAEPGSDGDMDRSKLAQARKLHEMMQQMKQQATPPPAVASPPDG